MVGRLSNWVKLGNGKFQSLEAVEAELAQDADFEQLARFLGHFDILSLVGFSRGLDLGIFFRGFRV